MSTETTGLIVVHPDREQILAQALARLAASPPSTKGMGPKDRANRLHAEILRRAAIATAALANAQPPSACPACGEEVQDEDATSEGDDVYHFGCIGVTDE